MAYPTYLVSATPGLDALRKGIVSALKDKARDEGRAVDTSEPLVPVSPVRAILPAAVAEALVATRPGVPINQLLVELQPNLAEARPIGSDELARLMAYRDRRELGLSRDIDHPDLLVEDGHDWHLSRSRLIQAWGQVGGRDAIAGWSDLIIGHIDTGFTEHPALGWQPGGTPCIDTLRDHTYFAADMESEMNLANRDPESGADRMLGVNCGHGTSTAGVLAGYDRRDVAKVTHPGGVPTAEGYFGAAPRVRVVPVRISDCVLINAATDALGKAIDHLLRFDTCRVITLSMGATFLKYLSPATREAIDRAYEKGVIICCAAGNVVRDVVVPARTSRTVCVAGSTITRSDAGNVVEVPWTNSARGAEVDIAAPAWPIRRPHVEASLTGRLTFDYGYGGGTSYATPQVAATAAMWLVKRRDELAASYPQPWQRVAAFVKLLRENNRPWQQQADGYGPGLLDAEKVLNAPLPMADSVTQDTRAVDDE